MLIQTILNTLWQITTLIVALPFKILNEIIMTMGEIVTVIVPSLSQQEVEETEETVVQEQPQYPEPVEVKGFHHRDEEQVNNEENTEENVIP